MEYAPASFENRKPEKKKKKEDNLQILGDDLDNDHSEMDIVEKIKGD